MHEHDETLKWDDRPEDKGMENEHFSRPSSEIIAYAQANQLHSFNLWSKAVQRMMKLRMEHPEWKEAWNKRRQEHRQLVGQPIICMLQMLFVGRVEKVDDETMAILLADQSSAAAEWLLRSVLPRHPMPGLYRLPADFDFPFTLTYERGQACIVELIMLPGHGEVNVLEES